MRRRLAIAGFMLLIQVSYLKAGNPEYLSGNQPREVTDQYCAAYAVWHVLWREGKTTPLASVIQTMKINSNGGASLADVVSCLRQYGVEATAVKIDPARSHLIDRMFIPFIQVPGDSVGHIFLCVPTGDGRATILDGKNSPDSISLSSLENERGRAGWDGTCVLIAPESPRRIAGVAAVVGGAGGLLGTGLWLILRKVRRRR
jgi:ABC-type bacteriocin/lantibiotic exporter with double-glycine peptidase domain